MASENDPPPIYQAPPSYTDVVSSSGTLLSQLEENPCYTIVTSIVYATSFETPEDCLSYANECAQNSAEITDNGNDHHGHYHKVRLLILNLRAQNS